MSTGGNNGPSVVVVVVVVASLLLVVSSLLSVVVVVVDDKNNADDDVGITFFPTKPNTVVLGRMEKDAVRTAEDERKTNGTAILILLDNDDGRGGE